MRDIPFDLQLEQTNSHSARWLHCSQCLPDALFTDRSRLPFVAVLALLGLEGSRARGAVSQVSSNTIERERAKEECVGDADDRRSKMRKKFSR